MAYSLKEIKALRHDTLKEIGEIIKKETANGPKTAAELADATGGLCSKHHIANSVGYSSWYGNWTYAPADCSDAWVKMKINSTKATKTRHFIEVDDNGEPIRRFDTTKVYDIRTYQAI